MTSNDDDNDDEYNDNGNDYVDDGNRDDVDVDNGNGGDVDADDVNGDDGYQDNEHCLRQFRAPTIYYIFGVILGKRVIVSFSPARWPYLLPLHTPPSEWFKPGNISRSYSVIRPISEEISYW